MYQELSQELIDFIAASPSCYHVVSNLANLLKEAGFVELEEGKPWKTEAGGSYYVVRNLSSIIAFRLPQKGFCGFQIAASHSESPTFKVKTNPEMDSEGVYVNLNVEKYGGMLCSTWLDRPLSVAGRAVVKNGGGVETRLVNIDRDLLIIPNLAIHMNRDANDGYRYNAQTDMLPLFGDMSAKGKFMFAIAEHIGVREEDILGHDLFLYNRMRGTVWGSHDEFVSSPKLDDLQCAFASIKGFLESASRDSVPVCCVFDNEEVGSGTKQGAKSTFLLDTLERINAEMGRTHSEYLMAVASSFMLSADNGHAVHPNHPEKSDPTNRPQLNGGVVLKYNANQKYTTDAVSEGMFKYLCESAKVPYQTYVNRSDMLGGSTLGNLSNEKVSLNTADIGLAQLAMHSSYETAGVKDTWYMAEVMKTFFSASTEATSAGSYHIHLG